MRWAMALFYFGAGVLRLRAPDGFLAIMPSSVLFPREVVVATGVCRLPARPPLLASSLRQQ